MTWRRTLATSAPEGRLPGAQQGKHRFAAGAIENVDRLEAGAVVVRIEQCQLLLAVRGIIGVVDVEHNAVWRPHKASAIKIDLAEADACERAPVGQILEPRQRRLAHQVGVALGRPADCDFQGGIPLESIDIVTILVTGRKIIRAAAISA